MSTSTGSSTLRLTRRSALAAAAATAWTGAARGAVPLGCGTRPCPFGPITTLAEARSALLDMLNLNLLPFWRRVCDESRGEGYDVNHDVDGLFKGRIHPVLVTQARMTWFFSRLIRLGYGEPADRARADRGYAILTRRFRDPVYGGFFWEVNSETYGPERPDKQAYGNAFALFALTEYAQLTGTQEARAAASDAWNAVSTNLWVAADDNHVESRLRNWQPMPANRIDYRGYLPGVRSIDTRIHLLEAVTSYRDIDSSPAVTTRLARLLALTEASVVGSPRWFFRQYDTGPLGFRNFGHDVEALSLALRARSRLGTCNPIPSFYALVTDSTLRAAEDKVNGGMLYTGNPDGVPLDRRRIDWAEAELMLTLAELYRNGRSSTRRDQLFRQITYLGRWQVDWANGSWHAELTGTLAPAGNKAGRWSGMYHCARAIMGTIKTIEAIQAGAPKGGCTVV